MYLNPEVSVPYRVYNYMLAFGCDYCIWTIFGFPGKQCQEWFSNFV